MLALPIFAVITSNDVFSVWRKLKLDLILSEAYMDLRNYFFNRLRHGVVTAKAFEPACYSRFLSRAFFCVDEHQRRSFLKTTVDGLGIS